jgi:hypothetical protein
VIRRVARAEQDTIPHPDQDAPEVTHDGQLSADLVRADIVAPGG